MCRSFGVYNYLKLCRWTSFQYRIKQHYNHNASGINHQTAAASFGRPIKGHMKYPLVFKSSFISCFFRHFSFFDLKKNLLLVPFHRFTVHGQQWMKVGKTFTGIVESTYMFRGTSQPPRCIVDDWRSIVHRDVPKFLIGFANSRSHLSNSWI